MKILFFHVYFFRTWNLKQWLPGQFFHNLTVTLTKLILLIQKPCSTAMKPIPHILFYFLVPTTLAVQARKSIQYYGKKIIFKLYLLLLKKY